MKATATFRLAWVAAIGVGVTACGLKGPLELPERSTNIVIRGPGQTSTTEPEGGTGTAPEATTPAPETTKEPTTKPVKPRDERLPPPQLPGGNPGSSRGG